MPTAICSRRRSSGITLILPPHRLNCARRASAWRSLRSSAIEAGAIEESQGNHAGAIKEYVASSLGDKPSGESRGRLLALARRPDLRAAVEAETAGLLKTAAPTSAAIELRVSVLDAQHRTADMAQELKQVVAQTDSFDVLDAITAAARAHALPEVEQLALAPADRAY